MRRTVNTSPSSNNTQSDTICLQQARHIVNMFSQCTDADGVYGFPFLPYLLEATITIVACLTRLPTLRVHYRETVEAAFKMLTHFCKKSWVSGRMARMIFKLGDIIPRVFVTDAAYIHPMQFDSSTITDYTTSTSPHSHRLQESNNMPSLQQDMRIQSHSPSTQPPAGGIMWSMGPPQGGGGKQPAVDDQNNTPMPNNQEAQMLEDENTMQNFQLSMIADFPFELNFGNTASQAIGPSNQAGLSNKEDFPTAYRGTFDLDWLDELTSQENRYLAPS